MIVIGFGKNKTLSYLKKTKIIDLKELLLMLFNKHDIVFEVFPPKKIRMVQEELFSMLRDIAKSDEPTIIISEDFLKTDKLNYPFYALPLFKYFYPEYILVFDSRFEDSAKTLSYILGVPYKVVKTKYDLEILGLE